jgi:hypothetical protein
MPQLPRWYQADRGVCHECPSKVLITLALLIAVLVGMVKSTHTVVTRDYEKDQAALVMAAVMPEIVHTVQIIVMISESVPW